MGIFLSTTLPLFIYFIIDAYFEFHIAIILTIIYGVIEFAFYYIKDKRVDKLILVSTILIVFMGGISYYFESDSLFKLKPAILQIFTVFFLLYFIITKKSILSLMDGRLPKNMKKISSEQESFIKKMTLDMTILLFLHSLLIVYSAYYMSTGAWVFISGALPYILIIMLMFVETIIFRKKQAKQVYGFNNKSTSIRDRKE